MSEHITCLVTIHGIGSERPPCNGNPGYADTLHDHLDKELNQNGTKLLSDDPKRQDYQGANPSVPIYVQSIWPPEQKDASLPPSSWEAGLSRLGSWNTTDYSTIETNRAYLVKNGASIAHVALVYSGLEGKGPEVKLTAEILVKALDFYRQQGRLSSELDMLAQDVGDWFLSRRQNLSSLGPEKEEIPCPGIRQDPGSPYNFLFPQHGHDFITLARHVGNDVAVYVTQNMLRQRVQTFIREALLRLALREDVSRIVLNTHSNGTVIGLDVLQGLPSMAVKKIRSIITSGCPLRKYVDLWKWGEYMTIVPPVERWLNFWDEADFIADPLRPNAGWHRDQSTGLTDGQLEGDGIYRILTPDGFIKRMPIKDIKVDNQKNSLPTGIPAHNYWDNQAEVIPRIAQLLRDEMKKG